MCLRGPGFNHPRARLLIGPNRDLGGDRFHVTGTLGVGHARPRPMVERMSSRGDRGAHVGRLCLGDTDEQFFRRRIEDVELGCGRRLSPLATDEESIGMLDRGNTRHRCSCTFLMTILGA